ncbi:MAG: hypothetical protein PPFGHCPK_01461 (plasmid) [Spiroplasma endosymbiont of Drosophila atripex]|nr:MAG: hypothetical protein PPFGHCPK_01461 [Spiroplasma endosymbiont of Drosophila atripex]
MPNNQNLETNFSYLNILRSVISPLNGMIGLGFYYGQKINNPILTGINIFLFTKKTIIDISNLNPNINNKLLNAGNKILLGLGTIGLANYIKFIENNINPSPTPSPITTTLIPTTSTTTTVNPFPPDLLFNSPPTSTDNHLMDWNTYISLNIYGISNVLNGCTELLPKKFDSVKKVANSITAWTLIATGVVMGEKNGYDNSYAIPTMISGINDIFNQVLPIISNNNEIEEINSSTINSHSSFNNNANILPEVDTTDTTPLLGENIVTINNNVNDDNPIDLQNQSLTSKSPQI